MVKIEKHETYMKVETKMVMANANEN